VTPVHAGAARHRSGFPAVRARSPQLPAVREVRDRYVDTARPPASTAVEVGRLAMDGLLLEVEAVAIVR
jgi:enamine deaminase RidA (YjgF/YER057c/UK114 family)